MRPYATAWVGNKFRVIFNPCKVRKKGKGKIKVLYRGNGKKVIGGKHYRQAIILESDIIEVF